MAVEPTFDRAELYIGGRWRPGTGSIEVADLAAGGTVASVAAATPAQAEEALAAAASAEAAMRETTVVQRAGWVEAVADGIEAHSEELTEVVVREAGKPVSSARSEVEAAAERFRRAAEEVRSLKGEYVEGTTEGHEGWRAVVRNEPVGTVLCITPYNYPLSTTALQVAPALAAGNAVILKPASKTPVSGALLAEILVEAVPDLPAGGFGFVPGRSSDVGDVLAGDDRLDAIAMTGSASAGKRVAAVSGMVELHMELGGNAPAVVFPDADLAGAAEAVTASSLKYAGQRCSAVSRVLAHEDVHEEVVDRVEAEMDGWQTGDLFDEETDLGPLISESQADWVEGLVDDAVERGARLVRGGGRDGRLVEPTLLAGVGHDARIVHEEQFGPVVAVTSFADEKAALSVANAGDLGLDAAVFTGDYDRAMRVADRLRAGGVRINGAPSHGLGDIPFGGVKDSGIGREGIGYTIETFLDHKSVVL
jgi:glyceraldehyde-3-phosphate dehydrogenase [NAD(P)+]